MWSYDNIILDSDIHVITDMEGKQVNRPGQIIFGDHVWLGLSVYGIEEYDSVQQYYNWQLVSGH